MSHVSLIKPVFTGLIVITLLGSVLLGVTAWQKVSILEAELIRRELISADYAEKKPLIPVKTKKILLKKKRIASKQRRSSCPLHVSGTAKDSMLYTRYERNSTVKREKHRSLDDVLTDIADSMTVVEDK